ncbi:DUF2752 domain-containing protein [Flavobacterium silvisoli]|uniref:DUF2752 domain-containing protein n=1 Tax=Flavobacterium silvisoli TaxID=2529433 RepID=A0A4Q9Z5N9_9FLAO|nr:DUF2752 domain-containing protein [Flavobacterium silvisoli]TBX70754.1 DUF2752 domain-containing protein [Flavobacterium silvisoli]
MTRNKLYSLLLIACFAGFSYLFYQTHAVQNDTVRVCIIKNVTGYPCPSCGTTRAVLLLMKGKITESLLVNPFGILVATIMTVLPIWIFADIVLQKETFYIRYKKTEALLRTPRLAPFLVLLVVLNWIWNLYKHL